MQSEIITIGDEILIGQVVDTNSAWIAGQLNLLGINVSQITSISDTKKHIITALNEAQHRSELILITGGLGPTKDDITKNVLCDFFQTELYFDNSVYDDIKKFLKSKALGMNELNRKQAEVLKNCIIMRNPNGTAPGMWFEKNNTVFVSMPGVPYEMKAMMENEILPEIKKRFKTPEIIHKTILTQGTFEAHLAELLDEWEKQLPESLKLAYLPSPGINRLRLSVSGDDEAELKKIINREVEKLHNIIPDYIFGYDEQTLEEIIGELLTQRKKTIATAESCTGGNIASMLTSISGSSNYFTGSVIAYSNEIKERVLKVEPVNIENYGAVSRQVVEEMAAGIQKLYKTDYAVATSGIAGPTGGTDEKPVGTTWIAVSSQNKLISEKFLFGENRLINIQQASITALNMVRKLILSELF